MNKLTKNTGQNNQTESVMYFQQANQLKAEKKYAEAVVVYRRAIECAGTLSSATYHYQLGEVLGKIDQWPEAVASYRIACQLNPKSFWYNSNLADALVKLGLFDEAVIYYRQAIEIKPDLASLHYNLGKALEQLGQFDQAINSYQKAIEINPNLTSIYMQLGEIYYRKAQETTKDEFLSKEQLDELFCQTSANLNNEAFVQAVYHAYLGRNADEEGKNFYLQRLELGINNRQEFIEQIRISPEFAIVSKQVSNPDQILDHCFCQMSANLDNNVFVEEVYNFYLRREPDEDGKIFHLQRLEKGINTRQEFISQIRDSQEFILRSKNFNGNPIKIKIKLSYLQKAKTNYDLAKKHTSRTFTSNKQLAEVYRQLGIVLSKVGSLEKALTVYQESISLDPEKALEPDGWEIYYNLAEIYLKMNWDDYSNNQLFDAIDKVTKAVYFYEIQLQIHPLSKTNIRFLPCIHLNVLNIWPVTGIGSIAIIDLYLKMSKLGWYPQYETILLAPTEFIVNPCLLDYWQEHLCIVSDPELIDRLLPLAKRLQQLEYNTFFVKLPNALMVDSPFAMSVVQQQWESEKRSPLLSLSATDQERGWNCLAEAGIPRDSWFVSLHVRESGYYKEHLNSRNADINTYIPAIKSIVARGGWVIRLGDPTMTPLPKIKNTFDYVHSSLKSDWMDIFLSTQCYFFLGSASGLISVPWVFNTPTLMTNNLPFGNTPPTSNSLFIPKLMWKETEQRYLSFAEMSELPFYFNHIDPTYQKLKIKLIDNTSEQIQELVLEMLDRLEGKVSYSQEDEILQERFRSVPTPYGLTCTNSRMGRNFLRKYAGLLPP